MSSSEPNEGDVTLIKTKITVDPSDATVTVSQTSATLTEPSAKAEFQEIGRDLSKLGKGTLKSLEGFRTFILRGNVVDLAIGIVIGAAFTSVVNGLVSDVLTPLIPIPNAKSLATAAVIIPWTKGSLAYGSFINAIISFVFVAGALYFFVVQPINRLMQAYRGPEADAPTTRDCPFCFQAVNILAVRCPFCTSPLGEASKDADIEKHGEKKEREPVLMLPEELEKLSDKLAEKILRKATSQLEAASEAAGGSAATE